MGTSYDALMQYFEDRLWKLLLTLNKTVIAWEEIFKQYHLSKFPAGFTVNVWKSEVMLFEAATAGHKAVMSYGWYLNLLQLTWVNFYNQRVFVSPAWNDTTKKLVLGGEISCWGEQVSDSNIELRLWPRTAAAAERLWTNPSGSWDNRCADRLSEMICRLNRRNVRSSPIRPGFCAW